MKNKSVNVDQMQLLVIIKNERIKINADVNVKNLLIKVYVINPVILVNIQIIQIVSVEKNQLIN